MGTTSEESRYRFAFKGLFPEGDAWTAAAKVPESVMSRLLNAESALFSNASCILIDLRKEFYPSTITELLDRWEADYGLPDGCFDPIGFDARLKYFLAIFLATGGSSKNYFIESALNLGLTIEIQEHEPFRLGDLLGTRFANTADPFEWIADITSSTREFFELGDPLGTRFAFNEDEETLRCLLDKIKPAHTTVIITS